MALGFKEKRKQKTYTVVGRLVVIRVLMTMRETQDFFFKHHYLVAFSANQNKDHNACFNGVCLSNAPKWNKLH